MRSFGASEDDIEQTISGLESKSDSEFEVWFDNWEAWELFSKCRQWRTSPMDGRILGLDWTVVLGVLDLFVAKRRRKAVLYDELRYIEHGALEVFQERRT